MKIYQFSCREKRGTDPRQADAVLRHKPDIIFREAPSTEFRAFLEFNPQKSIKVLESELREVTKYLREISKKVPWAISDIKIYENAVELLKNGHKVRIYNVDAPVELTRESILNKWNLINKPRRRGVHLLWWVFIYLRERMMSKNMAPLLKNENQTVLMFLQKFHWLNVKFLLSNPTKTEIWNYYFGKFKNINRQDIPKILKEKNKILYKYWLRHSDFT